MINPFAMLKDFSGAADAVLRGMKPTPGGDAFIYTGSMNAVAALRDALSAFHDWEMNCALESEDGVADCPQDDIGDSDSGLDEDYEENGGPF